MPANTEGLYIALTNVAKFTNCLCTQAANSQQRAIHPSDLEIIATNNNRYNSELKKGEILVDKRAPEWYKKLAAFHVEVCCDHQHEALIPDLTTDYKRCSMVEEYIAGQLSGDPIWNEYATARRRMLGFLLDTGLASPDQKESLLVILQGLL